MTYTLVKSAEAISKLRETARTALRAVRELERLDVDVYGRYTIDAGETIDDREVLEFLYFARRMYPQQELDLIVVARDKGVDKEEDRNGTGSIQDNGSRR